MQSCVKGQRSRCWFQPWPSPAEIFFLNDFTVCWWWNRYIFCTWNPFFTIVPRLFISGRLDLSFSICSLPSFDYSPALLNVGGSSLWIGRTANRNETVEMSKKKIHLEKVHRHNSRNNFIWNRKIKCSHQTHSQVHVILESKTAAAASKVYVTK